jgi:hypothetical protein
MFELVFLHGTIVKLYIRTSVISFSTRLISLKPQLCKCKEVSLVLTCILLFRFFLSLT